MSMRASLSCSLLLVSLLAGLPVAAQEIVRTIEMTRDADYFGYDLRTVQDVTLDECQSSCIEDQSCKAFTYNPKVSWCFLKSDFKQLNTFNGSVAGKIVEVAGGSGTSGPDIGAPPKLAFLSDQWTIDARDKAKNLAITQEQLDMGQDALLAAARAEPTAENALPVYDAALSQDPSNLDLWLEAAGVANRVTGNTYIGGQAALYAINAYQLSRTATIRADTLSVMAKGLENAENYRAAINAYKASLDLVKSGRTEAALADLKSRQGFRVLDHAIDANSADPRACVQFSEPLVKQGVDYAPYVLLDGVSPKAMEAKDNQICVEGLTHGQRYSLVVRAGLPSSVDEPLVADVSLDIYVQDRSASVRFTGDNFVLPSTARRGIPLVSVNTSSANLKLYRIGDRNIANLLTSSQFLTQMDTYSARRIQDESGQLVWQGAIDIQTDLNKEVITSFPVDEALPEREPGVYVLTAVSPDSRQEEWDPRATQWFVVSDIGLSTYTGTDGVTVFARSLATAKPASGVELQLLARNNEILGTATTDADGKAAFAPGLVRGTAAMVPAVITARKGLDDYVFLDMTRAGFDLSDRGVTGRAAPGAIDILAWTERGIYRPGETVHASALARDISANAIENLPLTFTFLRPDGVEDRRLVARGETLGGYALDLDLQANALRGTWTMQIFTDPKSSPIGEKQFLVDDFVPDRIEFDMKSDAKSLESGMPATVNIDGRFLYGAPAAGLSLEGEVVLKPSRQDAAFENYVFGLADEEAGEETRLPLEGLADLDENGQTSFDVNLSDLPSTTRLLNADITVRLREAGGRAVEKTLVLPVKSQGPMIGIKPEFSGALNENAVGKFHVIAVDPDSRKQALSGLSWKLVKVERNYQWYLDGTSWRYEPVTSTRQVANGTVDVTSGGGEIQVQTDWGRYRLEVETADVNGPMTSVEFDAGWYVEATSTETPDGLEIALDKANYSVGETARLKVSPRFAGEVMVTVGSESLLSSWSVAVPAEGGEIDIPVTADFGAGAYVTATLYRPGDAQDSHMPMRAIGIKWLTVNPQTRNLAITLDAPGKILPRGPLTIPVSVTGAGADEAAWVTVAAVDVGILNLTRYEVPNPDGWYFGQRRMGLEIRDLYGRLIDGSLGTTGKLRTGGDGGQIPLNGNPPTEKLVAFFSGPVKLDAGGKATVSFDIPQFNGTARIMAVAWSKSGVGHTSTDVIIRDPVVVTASLPKFLSPGDESQIRLDIANTDAPAGDYTLEINSNTVVTVDQANMEKTLHLEEGGKLAMTLPLIGVAAGDGTISLRLSGSGLDIAQNLKIPVRSGALPITTRHPVTLAPDASLTVDAELLADSQLPGASVAINLSRSNAFDIPALMMTLDRYPYGCAEQTTSRALPLLYLSDMARSAGMEEDSADLKKRVQDAIYRVLSYQAYSGSFGLWGPGSGDLWLDAYVTDFLTRAREQKYDVPEEALVQALENLKNSAGYDSNVVDRGNEIAYSLYVLARNHKATIADLRYYADTKLDEFPTPLSRAHLAAALGLYGDVQRSRASFAAALEMTQNAGDISLARSDYGSSLRDGAAVLALAAESGPQPDIIPQLTKIVAGEWENKTYTSTQEQTWMLMAARSLQGADTDLAFDVNGVPQNGHYFKRISGDDLMAKPVTITNKGKEAVTAMVTTLAAPAVPLPAGGNGFTIERTWYTLDGEEANITGVQQNERYVVVLTATEDNAWPSRIMISDLLPAGFEIDNPGLVNSAQLSNFDWLPEVEAAHLEFRSDRFVAAFDRTGESDRNITLAYVVRAVTPGKYELPAASIEDMYRPQFAARTSTSRMEVTGAPQ